MGLLAVAKPDAGQIPASIKWLTELKPPTLITCPCQLTESRLHYVLHNNEPGDSTNRVAQAHHGRILKGRKTVSFCWPVTQVDPKLLADLTALVESLAYLGQSQDFTAATCELVDTVNCESTEDTLWQPVSDGMKLSIATADDVALAVDAYYQGKTQSSLGMVIQTPTSTWKSNTPFAYKSQCYAPIDTQSLYTCFTYKLRNARAPISFDIRSTCAVAEAFRAAVVDLSKNDPTLTQAMDFITGHTTREQGHIGFLALPSINGMHPDGLIRRLALIGRAVTKEQQKVLARLDFLLKHTTIQLLGREMQLDEDADYKFNQSSDIWRTVTPICLEKYTLSDKQAAELKRLYKLKDAESLKNLQELLAFQKHKQADLVKSILQRDGYGNIVKAVQINRFSGNPIVPNASSFEIPAGRKQQLSTQRIHATILFTKPVKGPMLLGKGKFFGLGLLQAV